MECPRCHGPIPGPRIGPCRPCKAALAAWVEKTRVVSARRIIEKAERERRELDELLASDERERRRSPGRYR